MSADADMKNDIGSTSMEVDGTTGTADTVVETTTASTTTNSSITANVGSSDDAVIDEIESVFNKEFPPHKVFPSL